MGTLATFDGTLFHAVASHGWPDDHVARMERPFPPHEDLQPLLDGAKVMRDLNFQSQAMRSKSEVLQSVAAAGIQVSLAVPPRKDRAPVGFISAHRREARPFSETEITLLQNFATQAVIAMENARLLAEQREALEHQTATSDLLKVISRTTFDLDPVFRAAVSTAARVCRADQAVLFRNHQGVYRWAASYSDSPEYDRIEQETVISPGPDTIVGRAALARQPVQILDAWDDPLYEAKDEARAGGRAQCWGCRCCATASRSRRAGAGAQACRAIH